MMWQYTKVSQAVSWASRKPAKGIDDSADNWSVRLTAPKNELCHDYRIAPEGFQVAWTGAHVRGNHEKLETSDAGVSTSPAGA